MENKTHSIKVYDIIWREMQILAAKEGESGPNQLLIHLFLEKLKTKNAAAYGRIQEFLNNAEEEIPEAVIPGTIEGGSYSGGQEREQA